MIKSTWNVYLVSLAQPNSRMYLGLVYEYTELEAIASAEASLSSHDPDECQLLVEKVS